MKFKSIFIIFNILIVFFLLIMVFMPLLVLGPGFSAGFWRSAWPMGAVLAAMLLVLDVFYALNSRLYRLLEREDWPALSGYLESKVIRKGRYSSRLVRLLANTYLVMSDSAAVLSLENKTALARPSLVGKNALVFGVARILSGDTAGAVNFFSRMLEKEAGKGRDAQWIRWYYGFSLLLSRQFDKAAPVFMTMVFESPDALITGLSAYFLSGTLRKNAEDSSGCGEAAEEGRKRVRKSLRTVSLWKKETARLETEVHAAILRKYFDEAGNWLFEST
ncbi:MAG: hypothetical protein LBI86_04750 [Treponema sp.]|nr:hypothetical protein [Treponema sp.]